MATNAQDAYAIFQDLKHEITIEIEGETKPACVAELLTRLVFA